MILNYLKTSIPFIYFVGYSNVVMSSQRLFEEQLKKYEQVKVYIDQNLAAQENILKALTDANVQYATVRKGLAETEHK